jgi:hypothetical protein
MQAGIPGFLLQWMGEHVELVKYIQIDSINPKADSREASARALDEPSKITNFLHFSLIGKPPAQGSLFPIRDDLPKRVVLLARVIRFLQLELFEWLVVSHHDHIQTCNIVLDMLTNPEVLNSTSIKVSVLTDIFFADLLSPPKLVSYYQHKIELLSGQFVQAAVPAFTSHTESVWRPHPVSSMLHPVSSLCLPFRRNECFFNWRLCNQLVAVVSSLSEG